MFARCFIAFLAVLLLGGMAASAQTPSRAPTTHVQVQSLPPLQTATKAPPFDAEKAVNAYLATVKGAARANSDSYFEGGYYLLVVDTLYALAVSALLLWTRFSAWMRNVAAGFTRSRFWQAPIYAVQYVVATTILTFPLTLYEAFFREHAYGLSNQTFLQWFGEFSIQTALQIVIFAIALSAIYAAIRRTQQRWWAWGTAIAVVFMIVGTTIQPVFIDPMFNTYTSLPQSPLKDRILSLARANGIPAHDVYLFDASRQSKRISANVGGFLGTTRIALNDNLLHRTSQDETLAVLGHEMGHYVLDHGTRLIVAFGLVALLGFWIANWGFARLAGVYGRDWDVQGIDDPAGFPVLIAIATVFLFVMTPVTNTITRSTEAQADIFGLNAARQPDGFATVTLKLSEYRKLDPSPLEEFVFYDHPSGRSRITMAMRWKAEHLNDPDIKAGPVSPQ
ncbi:MAG TPA: M48 family metallopeptidase [Rhizomicrobium sp.]|jgi:STE24 endopeptidase